VLDFEVGRPILIARRTSRSADGMPVEHAVLQYRADRYRFRIELARA
jgi:GntR family transcriptional regulator